MTRKVTDNQRLKELNLAISRINDSLDRLNYCRENMNLIVYSVERIKTSKMPYVTALNQISNCEETLLNELRRLENMKTYLEEAIGT